MKRSLFIVVINPSPTVCQLLENELQSRGHQVQSFLDPVAALYMLIKTKTVPMPDILFISLKSTTQLIGYEVLRLLRTYSPLVPIVVISPPNDMLIRLKARLAGASIFLGDPVKIQQVVALVQRVATRLNTSTK